MKSIRNTKFAGAGAGAALGRVGRTGRLLAIRRSALALVAVGALLLAACGTSSGGGDDAATTTTAAIDSSATSATVPEADVIDPSLVGSTNGTSVLFPESGNGGYEVSVYDWDLALSEDLTSLSGVATITASATQDLQRFSLDARELKVESVTVDERSADFDLIGPELVITAREPLPAGSEFVIEVAYAATPGVYQPAGSFRGWDVVPGEQVRVVGFPGAAATWAPIDEDLDAPPARYVMRFDVPDGFTATASGVPTEEDESGSVVWDTGIEVFGATFAVAEFETNAVDWEVPVEVSAQPGLRSAEQLEQNVVEHLTFVESLLGPFPYERLGISALDGRHFAYSTPMRIVMPAFVTDLTMVHELAHQWAGNAVTGSDEGSNWLFEGLASYVEALWAETLSDDVDADATTRQLAGQVPSVTRTLDGVDSIDDLLDGVTYQRAELFYHALRLEIGDDAFFITLREFIQRNLHSTVGVEDLQAVAEEVSELDLDQFFTAWVSEPEVPELPETAQQ
jgi:predicted small secreted protein